MPLPLYNYFGAIQPKKTTFRKNAMELNEVYRKIKGLSAQAYTPRPKILIARLAQELPLGSDALMPHLMELKRLRLIRYDTIGGEYINLTLLGNNVTR